MKTKSILLLLFSAVLFLSCKNDKTESSKEEAATEAVATGFKVTLNVVVKKDDDFSLFYTEDGSIDFTKIPPIWMKVRGSDIEQEVVYTLPADVLPTQLRLDFGLNKDQQDIEIKKFKMEYMGKSFEINGNQLYIYFDPDLSKTIFDKATGVVKAVVKDGVRQSPSFYPNVDPLGKQIDLLVK